MQYLLFTGKDCPACHRMRENMIKAGMTRIEIDTDTIPGKDLAREYYVKSKPTLVVVDMRSDILPQMRIGKPIQSFVGSYPVSELQKIMKQFSISEALA